MKENVSPPHTERISRRTLLKGGITAFLLGIGAETALLEKNTNGLWRKYAKPLFSPDHWGRSFHEQPAAFYESAAHQITSELSDVSLAYALRGVDRGLQLYFQEELSADTINFIIELCTITRTDPGYALAVTGYWSRYKVGSAARMQRENAIATLQSILSTNTDLLTQIVHSLSPRAQEKAPAKMVLRTRIENMFEKYFGGNAPHGTIGTRTIGFSDRGVSVYAKALSAFSQKKDSLITLMSQRCTNSDTPAQLFKLAEKLNNQRARYSKDGSISWEESNDLITTSHALEHLLLNEKESVGVGLGLEILLRSFQYQKILVQMHELHMRGVINWGEPPFTPQQQVLCMIYMLVSSDAYSLYELPQDYLWNNRTDGDNIHPDWVLSKVMTHTFETYLQLAESASLNMLTPESIARLVLGNPQPTNLPLYPYLQSIYYLFTTTDQNI